MSEHKNGQGYCLTCHLAWPCPTASGLLELAELVRPAVAAAAAGGLYVQQLDALTERMRGRP